MKYIKSFTLIVATAFVFTACTNNAEVSKAKELVNIKVKEDLGRSIFFDVNLSKNRTQSCSTCHNP